MECLGGLLRHLVGGFDSHHPTTKALRCLLEFAFSSTTCLTRSDLRWFGVLDFGFCKVFVSSAYILFNHVIRREPGSLTMGTFNPEVESVLMEKSLLEGC